MEKGLCGKISFCALFERSDDALNNWIPFIYDAAAVVLLLICMARGAKDGFAKTFVQTVGMVVSVAAALYISRICASLIYTTAIQPGLLSTIQSSVENAVDTESVVDGLKSAVAGIPALSAVFLDFSGVEQSLDGAVNLESSKIAEVVEANVIRPVVEPLLQTVIFIASLIILLFVVTLLAKGSKSFNRVPVIGGVNSFLGAVMGIRNGGVLLCAAAAIISLIISAKGESEYLSSDIISNTYLFKWIYGAVTGGLK